MIELSRHIECLMLDHDCVIVPGLGGFVTQYVSARYIAEEQLFLPPYRSVGFNQQLSLNDGLLVQSYMQTYDTDYPETIKIIEDAVAQLKKELQDNGEYEFNGIGKLTLGIGGTYNFIPCEAGVLSPELYGLDAVNVAEVKNSEVTTNAPETKEKKRKVRLYRNEKNYTITLNRELVNYVAAAIVAIFFYFIWATPINNTTDNGAQTASVLYEQLFNASTLQAAKDNEEKQLLVATTETCPPINLMDNSSTNTLSSPIQNNTDNKDNNKLESQKLQNNQIDNTEKATLALNDKQESGKYTLVLASAITEKNAQAMSDRLKTEGYRDVQPYKRGRMVRVICGQYSNKQQAQEALAKMQENSQFAEAWVLELK